MMYAELQARQKNIIDIICYFLMFCVAAGLIFLAGIHLGRMEERHNKTIYTYGPEDWREKQNDCERRARLINGSVEFVADDKYCIVKDFAEI